MSKRVNNRKGRERSVKKRDGRPRRVKPQIWQLKTVVFPEDFRLTTNIPASAAQVAKYIAEMRGHVESRGRVRLTVNFNAIRQVDAAAALMLTAEIHIWSLSRPWAKLCSQDDKWHPEIRGMLADMGLFPFLGVSMQTSRSAGRAGSVSYVQFISDTRVYMRIFENFQRDIEEKMGEGEELGEYVMSLFYSGLQEAVLNVRHHAYAKNEQHPQWWVSASFDHESRNLKILCYDRGLTIPQTLRTEEEKRLRVLTLGLSAATSDSALIKAALHSRTSTNQLDRGKGLPEMADIINRSKYDGELSVYSGNGMARYEKKSGDSPGSYSEMRLEAPIRGTLIEWRIRIPPLEGSGGNGHVRPEG